MKSTIGLIILASLIEGFGDYNIKQYTKTKNNENLILALGTYNVLVFVLIEIFKQDRMSISNALWNSGSLMVNSFIGINLFNEQLTEKEKLSMLLAFASGSLGIVDEERI
jgi:multidrug transporter EmrE-like cation transporter